MQARLRNEPRKFSPLPGVTISDCGEVELDVDEQITLCLEPGRGNDLIRKTWGFYLSNSLNANLVGKGFRMALVVSYASDPPRTYLNMVATEKMASFQVYLQQVNARVVCWLDEWLPVES